MWSAEDEAEWACLEKERKLREARERVTKRKAGYRKLNPPPPCCGSCQFGDINESCPTCYFGAYSFDIDPFGICDNYKRREP